MKFRRRPLPLLLLLIPSLVSALSAAAQDNVQSTLNKNTAGKDPAKVDTDPPPVVDLNTKSKFDIGTKDAPVDGKDGKPHAGPWVGTEKDPKTDSDKPSTKKEEAQLVVDPKKDPKKESTKVGPDGTKIPLVNDGVMDDPNREVPKQGTTGTEGGVSEKDKARKAQEGQTGEKVEKKPDSPKEAPPLPHSEQTKVEKGKEKEKEKEKSKSKDGDSDDNDTAEGLAGLEVRLHILLLGIKAN
jgi:Ca2+/H+ antiporter, TMEM165/GDT1 family